MRDFYFNFLRSKLAKIELKRFQCGARRTEAANPCVMLFIFQDG